MGFVADRRLYLNADKSAVVEEGDPAGAFLLVPAGKRISPVQMERYGLAHINGIVALPGQQAEAEPEVEAAEPEAPKRRRRGA